jgi:hypothetical protein
MVASGADELAARSMRLTLFPPVLATIAHPVAGFIATSLGDDPAGSVKVRLVEITEAPVL